MRKYTCIEHDIWYSISEHSIHRHSHCLLVLSECKRKKRGGGGGGRKGGKEGRKREGGKKGGREK